MRRTCSSPAPPGCSGSTCCAPASAPARADRAGARASSTSPTPTRSQRALDERAARRGHQLRRVDRRRRRREPTASRRRAVNADGAGNLARAAAARRAPLVHVSTDYVFDGARRSMRRPTAPTWSPTRPGRARCTARPSSRASSACSRPRPRTRWCAPRGCSAPAGATSPTTMLRLAGEREAVQVVTDQVGCPTWTGHLAPALIGLLERGVAAASRTSPAPARVLERLRARDLPPGRAGLRGARRPAAPRWRAPPRAPRGRVLAVRARGRAAAAAVAGRPGGLPRGARWDDAGDETARVRRRRLHRLELRRACACASTATR